MTAIVAVAAEWGVLIAADGRLTVPRSPEPKRDNVQKIFPVSSAGKRIAYALAGHYVVNKRGIEMDLQSEFKRFAEDTPLSDYGSAHEYINSVNRQFANFLEKTDCHPQFNRSPYDNQKWLILESIFAGCDGSIPFVSQSEITNDDNGVYFREKLYTETPGSVIMYGSDEVRRDMYSPGNAPRSESLLRRFAIDLNRIDHPSVDDVKQFARGYIDACCSLEGRAISPNGNRTIGGHVHVATIKPGPGFNWEIHPLGDLVV